MKITELRSLLARLDVLEREMTDAWVDALDAAEEAHGKDPEAIWDYASDEDGEPGHLYPENACPHLDTALHEVREAWASLNAHIQEVSKEPQ